MSYRIILDSCGELTEEMKNTGNFINVPLTLQVGEVNIIDDETFDQANFLNLVASSTECPKSACPSPEQYIKALTVNVIIFMLLHFQPLSAAHITAPVSPRNCMKKQIHTLIYMFSAAGQHRLERPL